MGGGFVSKSFWIPLMASFGTMILLYIIGFIADIDFLYLKFHSRILTFALLPIAVGMLEGLLVNVLSNRNFNNVKHYT